MGECLVPDAVEDVDALLDLLEDAVDLALQLPAGAHGCPAGGRLPARVYDLGAEAKLRRRGREGGGERDDSGGDDELFFSGERVWVG